VVILFKGSSNTAAINALMLAVAAGMAAGAAIKSLGTTLWVKILRQFLAPPFIALGTQLWPRRQELLRVLARVVHVVNRMSFGDGEATSVDSGAQCLSVFWQTSWHPQVWPIPIGVVARSPIAKRIVRLRRSRAEFPSTALSRSALQANPRVAADVLSDLFHEV
jgi:hypothetical protein